jgi:Mg-chelatase subunit ChlD
MRGILIAFLLAAGLASPAIAAADSSGAAPDATRDSPLNGDAMQAEHVLILLDASGSMNSHMEGPDPARTITRMDAAKQAIAKVIEGFPTGVRIGLLVFSSRDGREWVYPLGPMDKARFRAGLMSIRAHGGTPLGDFMEKAVNALLAKRLELKGYGDYRLVVVTDGEGEDPERMDAAATQLLSRGISLDVVGVQMSEAHALSAKAHSYREAGDMAGLETAIRAILAEIGGSAQAQGDAEAYALANAFSDSAAGAVLRSLATGLSNEPIGAKPVDAAAEWDSSPTAAAPPGGGMKITWWMILLGIWLFIWFGRRLRRVRR